MLFDLHCHSRHSRQKRLPTEGIPAPRDMVREAKRKGLAGIALTDHNTTAGLREARTEAQKQGILLIPGEEIDTVDGHLLALGISDPVPAGLDVAEAVERIRAQGGLAVASHPYDIKGDGIRDKARLADAMEAWSAICIDRFSNRINDRKATEFGKPKISGSDAHTLEMIGIAPNRMEAQTVDEVLACIRAGRVELTKQYIPLRMIQSWSRLRFQGSYADVVAHIQTYSAPRAWLASGLLNRYVAERSTWLFNILARVGVCTAAAYSAMLTATRY